MEEADCRSLSNVLADETVGVRLSSGSGAGDRSRLGSWVDRGLLNPADNADFFARSSASIDGTGGILLDCDEGTAGISRVTSWLISGVWVGRLGGRAGWDGRLFSVVDAGEMLVVLEGARLTYLGRSVEYFLGWLAWPLGGRAGRSLSPHAGAFTRSVELLLEAVVREAELPPVAADERDSVEGLLSDSSDSFLTGRGGNAFLTGRGGGAGRLPMVASVTEPLSCSGGLLTDFCLIRLGRRAGICGGALEVGRGGSPGVRPVCEAFRAAIRC